MTRMALTRISLVFLLLAFSTATLADVLLIQEVRQADGMNLPTNGLTMSEVEAAYGTPSNKQAAIGDPPITRWVYDRWSVFFEYDRVLYTALHPGEVIEGQSQPQDPASEDPDSN